MALLQKNAKWIIIVLLGAIALSYGFQNRIDPFWTQLDQDLKNEVKLLSNSASELQQLFEKHVKDADQYPPALDILSAPFLPTMEFEKFKNHFERVANNKIGLFSGVTGAGGTTLIESISKLLVPEETRRMQIQCAPMFDLELHKKYFGEWRQDIYIQGDLIKFWERCKKSPNQNFLLIIDDFDKINPETFFGPDLWRKLEDQDYSVELGKEEITIPSNFYLIMTVHGGLGNRVNLNNEHFKRLGSKVDIDPEYLELIQYIREKKVELGQEIENLSENQPEYNEAAVELAALSDQSNIKRFIYFFHKTNEMIADEFSKDFRLGQWSNIRKMYMPQEIGALKSAFKNHVNALYEERDLIDDDFKKIEYSINNSGKMKGSNPIAQSIAYLEEKGFLTEFLVGLSFMLITGLASIYFFRKKIEIH